MRPQRLNKVVQRISRTLMLVKEEVHTKFKRRNKLKGKQEEAFKRNLASSRVGTSDIPA